MQLIAVDVGNSSTKIAVALPDQNDAWKSSVVARHKVDLSTVGLIDHVIAQLDDAPAFWSVCSVNRPGQQALAKWVEEHRPQDRFHPISAADVPLKSNVESREQLGRDRLLAAWIATELNQTMGPVIVVDAGTATTIDFIDADQVFQGGTIFPGAELCFEQLGQKTDALPDLSRKGRSPGESPSVVGKSTRQAIIGGVLHAQASAIEGIVRKMQLLQRDSSVFATGGGLKDLVGLLPEDWNHIPDLVLQGARKIGQKLV